MSKTAWMPRWRWVLLGAVGLALSSTLQAYRMVALGVRSPSGIPIGRLSVLNAVLWLAPAAMAPAIFRLIDWLTRRNASWPRSLAYHALATTVFTILHGAALFAVYVTMWGPKLTGMEWLSRAQSEYLGNLNFSLATYASIAALGYALEFRHSVHQRALDLAKLETQLAEERLGALAGELRPEFLYGSLETVSKLVHTNPDGADRIISKLADFLRLILNRSGTILGPLQDELECVERYIEIEQVRQGAGLSVTLDIDPETLDAQFPSMTLHNLVDIVLDSSSTQASLPTTALTIESSHRQGSLCVRVNGTFEGSRASVAGPPTRIGVVRERLQALYGEQHDVGMTVGERTSVAWITVPFSAAMAAE